MSFKKDAMQLFFRVPVGSFFLSAMFMLLAGLISTKPSLAQSITPELGPGGTDTTVTPSGDRFDIGGGRLSGDGQNLFHSFTNFGLQQNQIANFLSQPTIQNILGRVTGGNASMINGIIQVSGGNSNLFLINPAGIIFGQNASLNVPASFTATTANGIGFGSNGWFSASGSNNYASLLETPSSLAFTTGQAGAIVNAANLTMQQGQSLTLMGGTVVSTGELSAPGGNITVAAVPGTSLVRFSQPGSPLSLEIQPITPDSSQPNPWNNTVLSLPQLLTSPGAGSATGLTVNPDGTVQLTGSGIRVENGDLVTENINTSSTASSVNGGSILLSAQRDINTTLGTLNSSFSATDSTDSPVSGNGGAIALTTFNGSIATGGLDSHTSATNSDASVGGDGNGGAIALTTFNGSIATGNVSSYASVGGNGNGGAIAFTTQNGNITTGDLDSHVYSFYDPGSGNGGAITLSTQNGNIATGNLSSYFDKFYGGGGNGGAIALTTEHGNISTGNLDSHGSSSFSDIRGNSGAITLTTENGNISTGNLSSYATSGFAGGGNSGAITLITVNGNIATGNSNSSVSLFRSDSGSAGAITFTTQNGDISTGDLNSIGSGEQAIADSGIITLTTFNGNIATDSLDSSNRFVRDGGAITLATQNGTITTSDVNSTSYADSGAITLTTQNGNIATGDLNSFNQGGGDGGAVSVSAGNSITIEQINSQSNLENGGVVNVSAGNSITIGQINSYSFSGNGFGDGGSVTLDAGEDIAVSSINAQAGISASEIPGGTGGSVSLTAGRFIRISDSFTAKDGTTASISTQGGSGSGQIRIETGGGLENPFKVGDATTNGTARDITSGDFRISSTPVFTVPSPTYTQGNIEIIILP